MLCMLCLAACSRLDSTNGNEVKQEQSATLSDADIAGSWRLISIDGEKLDPAQQERNRLEAPGISFVADRYGATPFCNGLSGMGMLVDGRYYTLPGVQTLKGCPTPRDERLERALSALLKSSPLVRLDKTGQLRLEGGGHVVILDDRAPMDERQYEKADMILAGTSWQLWSIGDDMPAPAGKDEPAGQLRFEGDRWIASNGCQTMAGHYRQKGRKIISTGASETISQGKCLDTDSKAMAYLAKLMSASPVFIFDQFDRVLLASKGYWLVAQLDHKELAARIPELQGSWHIEEMDGRENNLSWKLSFSENSYHLETGCKPLEGIYIAKAARFYAAPLPTIDIGCPDGQGKLLSRIEEILSSAPSVSPKGKSGEQIALGNENGPQMVLQRIPAEKAGHRTARSGRVSGSFVIRQASAKPFAPGKNDAALQINRYGYELVSPCGTITGEYRNGYYRKTGNIRAKAPEKNHCPKQQLERYYILSNIMGSMIAVLSDDGTLLLVGNQHNWLIADREN